MQNFISIPKPCNENWDAMTSKEQGRHCAKCNVVVKDFSTMNEPEILSYLSKNKEQLCVRMEEKQMWTQSAISEKMRKFLYAFAICFLPFFSFVSLSMLVPVEILAQANAGGLEGKIINEKGEPIPFASVTIFQDGVLKGQGKTFINGNYKLKPLNPGIYTIKVRAITMSNIEITGIEIIKNRNITHNISMKGNRRKYYKVGGPQYPYGRMIDPHSPNKQEIKRDELRQMGR